MMKLSKFSTILITLLISNTLFADSKEIEELKSRMLKLEKQNSELMGIVKEFQQANLKEMKSELNELSDIVEEVERDTFMDRVSFGVGFKTRVDGYKKEFADGKEYEDNAFFSTKVMFNSVADISENMKFYGRISMYKYWDNETKHNFDGLHSAQGKYPSDSKLYLERAYINWLLNPNSKLPIVFTIGRLPTSEGPSYQFMDDTRIKGNYPASLFETNSDGAVLSFDLEKLTGIRHSAIRLFYSKLTTDYDTTKETYGMFKPIDTFSGRDNFDDSEVYSLFVEGSIPKVDSYFQLSYMYFNNKRTLDPLESPMCINPDATLDSGIVGEFYLLGSLIEFPNFMDSNFDFFAHLNYSKVLPDTWIKDKLKSVDVGSGYNYWLGTRYTLPFKSKPKIGLEYNHGSKNWFSSTFASHDLTNKLVTRGDAYEAYYIQPINENANIRIGGLYVDYKESSSGSFMLGTDLDKLPPAKQSIMLDELVNYYIQLNILY